MKCRRCRRKNPDGAKYCGYCQHELKAKTTSVFSGKKWLLVIGAVLLVLLLIPIILLWPCCHEWLDATCTEARICSKCETVDGEALGHAWKKATCSEPSICTCCGEANGNALGHMWKDVTEMDYVKANVITYSQCMNCKEKEGKKTDDLLTLLTENGKAFRIPPTEYFNRLKAIITNMDLDVDYSFVGQSDNICIEIHENGVLSAMVFFYKDRRTQDPVRTQGADKDKEVAFGSVQMVISKESSELDALLTAFVAACEPVCATDPDLAYEIVVGALEYSGEGVVYPYGSLAFLMNISEDFVILNAAPPQISK